MKLKHQEIDHDRTHLRIGIKIEGPEESWVRFAVLRIPVTAFDRDTLRWIVDQVARMSEHRPADDQMLY
jgi:hypothetical protein